MKINKAGRQLSPEQAAAAVMVAQAREQGLALTDPDGLLKLFTKSVLDTALNEDMTEHLEYEKHGASPDHESANVRNGSRPKTVIWRRGGRGGDRGPPPPGIDRARLARRLRRNVSAVWVTSTRLCCRCIQRGLTTGEISAHFRDIYGASVSKETASRITDKVT